MAPQSQVGGQRAATLVNGARPTDHDVDRIARRVSARIAEQIVKVAIVAALAIWIVPLFLFELMAVISSATRELSPPLSVAIIAAVLALPVVALILWKARARDQRRP
jgi:hypothetical protein